MPEIEFPLAFGRRFEPWSYQATHGVLLLRSNKTTAAQTRVDLRFRFVEQMTLRAVIDEVTLDLVDGVYRMSPEDNVVAGSLEVIEDDLESGQPSVFDDKSLDSHIIRSLYHHRY
ncbi:hypothetical protein N8J89_20710 [Crossiella sp. CA-258035]|uniref:hypothetical protein n=1 Tax=Crossiella sp. CA-258035 TaxID=2981138 RepID=UPI0024BCE2A9|nr:hypothetical protein [Crossiella sp. CA-258035]WHT23405.1 hypothetical protein N8J89_20710 [Crossiella sp. CA-258035]